MIFSAKYIIFAINIQHFQATKFTRFTKFTKFTQLANLTINKSYGTIRIFLLI